VKYLCLIYSDERTLTAMSAKESAALIDEHIDYSDALQRNGHLIAEEALHPVQAATSVRVRNGRLSATDGPFAETKQQLAGFFLVDVRDLNDAIQLAARNPAARYGSVEIRPIRELPRTG
jgi:hypothetical protein